MLLIIDVSVDFKEAYFSRTNLFEHRNVRKLSRNNYHDTVKTFLSTGYQIRSNKRGEKVNMVVFGTSTGASTAPKFRNEQGNHVMLPRPVLHSKPTEKGAILMSKQWFKNLTTVLEQLTISHVKKQIDNKAIMKTINFVKSNIHSTLRICDSCFTQMVILWSPNEEANSLNTSGMKEHIDIDDCLTCILTLGDVEYGGNTNYYNGITKSGLMKSTGSLMKTVPFEHGQVQIGNYRDIVHGVSPWVGQRITFNYHIQISVVNHFIQYGNNAYENYRKLKFPANFLYDG